MFDLRKRVKNTHGLMSPLPNMDGMLRRAVLKPFRLALDLRVRSAYEQITRTIVPEHLDQFTVTMPDGNMVSQAIQIGDCNAPMLMNRSFASYNSRFMDVYLNDIVIYSNSFEEHMKHVKIVLDILKREKLYLSRGKPRFLADELHILGRIIDGQGIQMDPEKVDAVVEWKMPVKHKESLSPSLKDIKQTTYQISDYCLAMLAYSVPSQMTLFCFVN